MTDKYRHVIYELVVEYIGSQQHAGENAVISSLTEEVQGSGDISKKETKGYQIKRYSEGS